eukprot:366524-Chlamydomonas_euryale.AAC.4
MEPSLVARYGQASRWWFTALDLLLQPPAKKVKLGAVIRAEDALKYFAGPGGSNGKKSPCTF